MTASEAVKGSSSLGIESICSPAAVTYARGDGEKASSAALSSSASATCPADMPSAAAPRHTSRLSFVPIAASCDVTPAVSAASASRCDRTSTARAGIPTPPSCGSPLSSPSIPLSASSAAARCAAVTSASGASAAVASRRAAARNATSIASAAVWRATAACSIRRAPRVRASSSGSSSGAAKAASTPSSAAMSASA